MASISLIDGEGLDAQGHGGQGRRRRARCRRSSATAPTTASSSTRGTSGGRTRIPPACPTSSIAARSTICLKDVEPRGKSPQASLKSIRVAPGFTVELVAAEPLVKDPIAFDWGADGKLWVVEMGDYPLGIDGKGKPGGVVRFLEDDERRRRLRQADDVPRRARLSHRASCPGGRACWSPAPRTSSMPRTATATARPTIARCSSPASPRGTSSIGSTASSWASTAGSMAPTATAAATSGRSRRASRTPINGRDFRFRPDTGEFEAESGQTQYGRHRDDWGHWFGNNNPNWGWHYVLADQRPEAQPASTPPPDPRQTLEPETRLFPLSRTLARFNDLDMADHVTSANSPTPYRDELFGPWFATSLFVSEPVHNLVHRIVLEPDGVTLPRPSRARTKPDREFLASSDNWFRPTMLKTGPDGALWIADMYRAVIEHPEWIPDDWEKRLDLRAGSEQGRIYRVYPVDSEAAADSPAGQARHEPGSSRRSTAPAAGSATRPSGCCCIGTRSAAIEPLRKLVRETKRPKTRVQAIWTLADLNGLDEASMLAGLEDPDPGCAKA